MAKADHKSGKTDVHMYVCIYVYMYVCVHVCMYVCMYYMVPARYTGSFVQGEVLLLVRNLGKGKQSFFFFPYGQKIGHKWASWSLACSVTEWFS